MQLFIYLIHNYYCPVIMLFVRPHKKSVKKIEAEGVKKNKFSFGFDHIGYRFLFIMFSLRPSINSGWQQREELPFSFYYDHASSFDKLRMAAKRRIRPSINSG
ncbi:MAG: hypothetical protein WKF35_09880 [Ferruginibacter sp.]